MFKELTDGDLIQAYGLLLKELRIRSIIRSKNVIGDLGERIALEHYNRTPGLSNLQLAPPSTANIDAISLSGERYAIKTTTGNITGVFYGLPPLGSDEEPKQNFEYAIIVKFDADHVLEQIIELTWEQFLRHKRWHSRMQAWNLSISRDLIASGKAIYSRSGQRQAL